MVDTLARQPIFLAAVLRLWCFWTCIVSVKHLACFVISNQQTILKRLRGNTSQYQASCLYMYTPFSSWLAASIIFMLVDMVLWFDQSIFKFLFSFLFFNLLTPVPALTSHNERWPLFHFQRHDLWLNWYHQLNGAWNMHKNAQKKLSEKLEAKFPATALSLSVVKIARLDDTF